MTLHSLEGEPQIANARKQHGNGEHLAARLCGEAKDGQILVNGRVAAAIRETTALEDISPLVLKGLT